MTSCAGKTWNISSRRMNGIVVSKIAKCKKSTKPSYWWYLMKQKGIAPMFEYWCVQMTAMEHRELVRVGVIHIVVGQDTLTDKMHHNYEYSPRQSYEATVKSLVAQRN